MFEEIFQRKRTNDEKLLAYGFAEENGEFHYRTDIMNGDFRLCVSIGKNGMPDTFLTESESGEEYILYKTNAAGSFVGEVRASVEEVLRDISDKCYETAAFRSEQSQRICRYMSEKYQCAPEFLWDKFPEYAVWRRKDTQKWYCVFLTISKSKLGLDQKETAEILDLRAEPESISALVDKKSYFPGWHMNKKHWYTVLLDGSVPFEELCKRIDDSYALAVKQHQNK